MTAEEAIRVLWDIRQNIDSDECYINYRDALREGIRALETISELEKRGITVDVINEYKTFEDECVKRNWTLNSLLEARGKQEAKKPKQKEWIGCGNYVGRCPNCNKEIGSWINDIYCDICGQKLDWSGV